MSAEYLVHGATLSFAWFLLLNLAGSTAIALISAPVAQRARATSPSFWLTLRLLPSVLSVVFVAAVFVPSYWQYEPREFVEGFDLSLTILAAVAFGIIAAAAARGAIAWRRSVRRARAWMRAARPLALEGATIPVFAIDAEVPLMALVGILRPRLLITRPVLDALTAEELRAAVAHEIGHWRALDNMKRLAMWAAPDFLSTSGAARAIERRWAAAAEQVADRRAGNSGSARCALASALVKVARLMPPATSIADPISALIDGGDITSRVQHLLDDAPSVVRGRIARRAALAAAAAALAVSYIPMLRAVHALTEILVSTLP